MSAAAGFLTREAGRCCNHRQKSRWVGRFWWDLWYFSINTNPILALCLSHPLHPVGRKERYAISAMQVRSEPSRSRSCLPCRSLICHLVSNVITQVLFLMIVACGLSEAQVRPRPSL